MKYTQSKSREGFTLVELAVTVAVIMLAAGIVLPSLATMITSGADAGAYNTMVGQLIAARALAIKEATYAGVHVQLADDSVVGNEDLENVSFMAVVKYGPGADSNAPVFTFRGVAGYPPRRIPGTIAFGQLTAPYVSGGSYDKTAFNDPRDWERFTSFTVVFSPFGRVVRHVQGGPVQFNRDGVNLDPLFNGEGQLWDSDQANTDAAAQGAPNGEEGAAAMTLFDYGEIEARGFDADDCTGYLNEAGQFLPINVYTGQLFLRR